MPFEYFNVTNDGKAMSRMLGYTKGERTVPVIVEGGQILIGYAGGS